MSEEAAEDQTVEQGATCMHLPHSAAKLRLQMLEQGVQPDTERWSYFFSLPCNVSAIGGGGGEAAPLRADT